jgi:hypothetical protein
VLLHVLSSAKNTEDTRNNRPDIRIIDFTLSEWLTVDSNYILGLLHCMVVGNVGDLSEIYNASIFRVKMCKVGEFLCICRFVLKKHTLHEEVGKVGVGGLVPTLTLCPEILLQHEPI